MGWSRKRSSWDPHFIIRLVDGLSSLLPSSVGRGISERVFMVGLYLQDRNSVSLFCRHVYFKEIHGRDWEGNQSGDRFINSLLLSAVDSYHLSLSLGFFLFWLVGEVKAGENGSASGIQRGWRRVEVTLGGFRRAWALLAAQLRWFSPGGASGGEASPLSSSLPWHLRFACSMSFVLHTLSSSPSEFDLFC